MSHPSVSNAPVPCRFCAPDAHDFAPCYASALVFPGRTGLQDAILDAEKVNRFLYMFITSF